MVLVSLRDTLLSIAHWIVLMGHGPANTKLVVTASKSLEVLAVRYEAVLVVVQPLLTDLPFCCGARVGLGSKEKRNFLGPNNLIKI